MPENDVQRELLFSAVTPLHLTVRVTETYWRTIVSVKHPVMAGRQQDVMETLEDPEEIRISRRDPSVLLFYRAERPSRWVCAVVKRLNSEGFLITTYPTDAIKEGERIWHK